MPSARFIRALAAQETPESPVVLLTLTHAVFPAPVRVADSGRDIISTAATLLIGEETEAVFEARAMTPILPGDSADVGARRGRFVIDNTDLTFGARLLTAPNEIDARIDLVLAAYPNDVEWSVLGLRVTAMPFGVNAVELTLSPREDSTEPFPFQSFTRRRTPGLGV